MRGILEVTIPLNNVISDTNEALNIMIVIYTILSLLGLIGLILMIKKHNDEAAVLITANNDLQTALDEIKTLQGIIPICSYCYKIRNDEGAWDSVDAYISKHSDAKFSHGACPECLEKVFAEIKASDHS